MRVCRPGGQLVLMVYHRRSLFFVVYRGFQRFLPLARRLGLHFEGARAGETEGLIARHFTVDELRAKLEAPGCATSGSSRTARTPSCCRSRGGSGCRSPSGSRSGEGPVLRRLGHQLGVRATKP